MPAIANTTGQIKHSDLGASLTGDMAADYMAAIKTLAVNPGLTNYGVSQVINRPPGSMGVPCRAARETLGLYDKRGTGVVHITDSDRYLFICKALGVTPATGTSFTKVHEGSAVVKDASPPEADPLADIRVAISNIRKQMKAVDIERIVLTVDNAEVTRSIRTTSVIRI